MTIFLYRRELRRHSLPVLLAAAATLAFGVPIAGCRPPASTAASDKESKGSDKGEDAAAPTVAAATVHTGTIEQALPVTGTLQAPREQQAAVGAPVGGVIDELPVHLGDSVTRGQLVAHLSTRALLGQIEQAQATVAQNAVQVQQAEANAIQQQGQTRAAILQAQSAASNARAGLRGAQATQTGNQATLTNARESLARAEALFKDGLVARKDVEAAQLAVRTAEAQIAAQEQTIAAQRDTIRGQEQAVSAARAAGLQDVVKQKDIQVARRQEEAARAALETARAQVGLYTVRSPLAGTVTALGAGVGETVDTTTKIVTITDLERLNLQLAVPSASASTVRPGQEIVFTVDALPGRTFRSVVRSVGTQLDPASNTVTVLADIANPGHALKVAQFIRARIVTARHTGALLAPRAAVLFEVGGEDGGASVLRIGADGTVHKVAVHTGLTQGDQIEIVSGSLHTGDRVATTGAYGLEDGAKVQVSDGKEGAVADQGAGS